MKGHNGPYYSLFVLFLGSFGMLMIIALPDMMLRVNNEEKRLSEESGGFMGNNNLYENGVFAGEQWPAPEEASVSHIKDMLAKCKLEGRRIKRVKLIGLDYDLTPTWVENTAYSFYSEETEEERQKLSEYDNIDPNITFARSAEIDEPLLIEFEDGDVFEIDTPFENIFRFDMNTIPWEIKAGTNLPNVDANVLFAPALGRRIVSVEVTTCIVEENSVSYLRLMNQFSSPDQIYQPGEQVDEILLWLEGDIGICITGFFDYCHVSLFDKNTGYALSIPFGELKPALNNDPYFYSDD